MYAPPIETPTEMTAFAAEAFANAPADIPEVLERMDAIGRAHQELPRAFRIPLLYQRPGDGIACFNALYRLVTCNVERHLARATPDPGGPPLFNDEDFVRRLVPLFASFYFTAYERWQAGRWVPKSWKPLFAMAGDRKVLPLGSAFAGMNAHINHDLAYALAKLWESEPEPPPGVGSLQHEDFVTVNQLLIATKDQIKPLLMNHVLRLVDLLLGKGDDAWVVGVIRDERDDAWREGRDFHAELTSGATDPFDADGHAWRDRAVGALSRTYLLIRTGVPETAAPDPRALRSGS